MFVFEFFVVIARFGKIFGCWWDNRVSGLVALVSIIDLIVGSVRPVL